MVCKNYGRDLVGSNWVFYGVQGLTHGGVNIGNFHIKRPGRYRLSTIAPKSFWGRIIFLSLLPLCGASGASNIQWWILVWISTFYLKWGNRAFESPRGPYGQLDMLFGAIFCEILICFLSICFQFHLILSDFIFWQALALEHLLSCLFFYCNFTKYFSVVVSEFVMTLHFYIKSEQIDEISNEIICIFL